MSEQRLAVIVLAAGSGTRMRSAKPKVMHELAGLPLLGHVLATATSLGAAHVVPVVRHQKDLISEYISAYFPTAVIAEQDDVPGTGRAVECGLEALPADFDGAVIVTSGDVPLLDVTTLESLLGEHLAGGYAASILTAVVDDPTGYGRIIRSNDGKFIQIVEHRDADADQLEIAEVNAGVYVFDAANLRSALAKVGSHNAQGEKYLTDAAAELLHQGKRVQALAVADNWLVAGINDRVQLSEVAAELNYRICEAWQRAGVTIQDSGSTWIDVTVQLGEDVTLLAGTQLKGLTQISAGATVGPEVYMVDTQVAEGATVVKSHVTGSIIGAGASVGPFSFLRAGTELGADGKIGTFVETKNAKIGAGSKVPHLSYVGDATIGELSNIGAGTIFANYDGVAKHSSTVGSHVRTGSHNVFVAPITIGDGAYTAAGTVVRRSVEAGDLAMNVAPQRNLADWVISKRPGTKAAEAAHKAKN
ncbi:bifunctional UDP-N-acetylglucosamine diphosphorylase/glucosamine-1-phosphate N-acetyltransferase GlmU [Rhodoluna limnophila]|uniref:bifunctional UDP-N-acetylglucosamine diphosphorylase/glucosamine-1-phosphate N-acetyltransferase GlmU n=1 Tax=Rhodoluna limnophila TaxID=232537 RepID=UPI001107554A|nr:bifunctional UDP-N-acetylglucosamine diphosphorylase/glucosamine-1-phosphate N-acetyltransferase GlmU [Rhodoluna limnophila]